MLDYSILRAHIHRLFANDLRGLLHDCELRSSEQVYNTATSAVSIVDTTTATFKATIAPPKTEILADTASHMGQSGNDSSAYQSFVDPNTIYDTVVSIKQTSAWLLNRLALQDKVYVGSDVYVIKEIQPLPSKTEVIIVRMALLAS